MTKLLDLLKGGDKYVNTGAKLVALAVNRGPGASTGYW